LGFFDTCVSIWSLKIYSNKIFTSTDGINWTERSSGVSGYLWDITYGGYVLEQMGGSFQGTELILSTVVTTLAGSGSPGSADATGTSSGFRQPYGITTDGTNLYVADSDNHRIRKIVISTGVVTILAGSSIGDTDSTGSSAKFSYPYGITTDGTNLYVGDTQNKIIRKIE
jgi:hypothetical protein